MVIVMKNSGQICKLMILLGGAMLVAIAGVHAESNALTQTSQNSSSSSTVCVNNQCMTCTNGQACQISKNPGTESRYDDNIDDILDDVEDELDVD
jgi:hypothetical protein